MPGLLLIDDFPRCTSHKCIGKGSSSALINRCRELLSNPIYRKKHFMLCVISDGDDWQVLHPVLSDLQGGTAHPRQNGWLWWGRRGHSEEELRTNHDVFTKNLKSSLALPLKTVRSSCGFLIFPNWQSMIAHSRHIWNSGRITRNKMGVCA
ncbi:MAG: hypothetical protein IJT50_09830 [Lentisphaeria bacterium]|nr:hypothetical protein [Lentisphaeria bacterium]